MVMFMLRTTIMLREDIYDALVRIFGKRNLSRGINDYLVEHMFKEKGMKDMFGADRWLQKTGWKDLRDHREHNL